MIRSAQLLLIRDRIEHGAAADRVCTRNVSARQRAPVRRMPCGDMPERIAVLAASFTTLFAAREVGLFDPTRHNIRHIDPKARGSR